MLYSQQSPPMPDQDPFVGRWRANAAQSRPKLDKTQASYERVIAREGDELLFLSTGGPSKARVRAFRLKCDNRFYSLPDGPVLRCMYSSPNRVDGEARDPTGDHHYWTREVSADGKQMTISEYKDSRRAKVRSVMVLDRIK
jgi:hypothetical protein